MLKENAERIARHGHRIDEIVRGMLLHASGKPGRRQSVDLNALVMEYVNLAYHGMRGPHADIDILLKEEYDEAAGHVELIPQEVGRALINVLQNAFMAVREQWEAQEQVRPGAFRPAVWVRTRKRDQWVDIQVQDNGVGIPESIRDQVFEPFFSTRPTESTGLGLSLAYEIVVKGHRGDLTVESTEGAGATFTMTLPATPAEPAEPPAIRERNRQFR